MGVFDWLGPLTGSRGGWDTLPPAQTETKTTPAFIPADANGTVVVMNRLVQVPGPLDATTGSGSANSAVYACLQAIATAIAEPELTVYRVVDGDRIEQPDAPLAELLRRPNPSMTLDTLLWYLAVCLKVDGNAYWRKLRAGDPERGNVVELWPIAPSSVEPVTRPGSADFVSFYRYTSSGREQEISPANIVHFKNGLDSADHRLGSAPLKRLLREISSDAQATRYADRLLANLAINGLSLSFDKDAPSISQATADELKARISGAYGGDNVGSVAVLSPGAELTALGFSPEQMDLKVLHRVPEERISSVLGVPAIVAGLGAGLDRATYANFSEAREAFTEMTLIPTWRSTAATITLSLLPDFTSDPAYVVDFDIGEVRALASDQNALAERLKVLVEAGIITTDEARAEIGLEAMPSQPTPAPLRQAVSRRPTELRALPTEKKAAEDLPRRYDELRAQDLPDWEREIVDFLDSQLRRVTRRLRAGADTAHDLVPEGETVLLGETLRPLQLTLLHEVERLVQAEMGITFSLDDPATRLFLRECGINIGSITETTRTAVQDALTEGQMAGEGIEDLARRLRGLPAFGSARARVVARTELGTSQNQAALSSYRASGVVVGIRVHDGDYDAACEAIDGRVFPLDQVPPALQHPNCTRAYAPLTDPAELTRSA